MKYPKVSIILLNYKTYEETIECIKSLENITYPNFEIIIVDNDSQNNSEEILRQKFCRYLIIQSHDNLGFSGGCNIGIKEALKKETDYILLLNNDTVVNKTFLEPLVQLAETNEKIGAVGGKIYYCDPPGKIWSFGGKINFITGDRDHRGFDEFDIGKFEDVIEVGFISCANILVKRKVLEEIGLLSERYFFGFEEMDFSMKIRNGGYKILYTPKSKIWHKVGKSHERFDLKFIYNSYRNKLIFMETYLSGWKWAIWYNGFKLYIKYISKYRIMKFYKRDHKDYKLNATIIQSVLDKVLIDHKSKMTVSRQDLLEIDPLNKVVQIII